MNPPKIIKLYPNPVKNILTIENTSNECMDIMVSTMAGSLMVQTELATGYHEIDISTLPPGVYLVSVAGVTMRLHLKVLKE